MGALCCSRAAFRGSSGRARSALRSDLQRVHRLERGKNQVSTPTKLKGVTRAPHDRLRLTQRLRMNGSLSVPASRRRCRRGQEYMRPESLSLSLPARRSRAEYIVIDIQSITAVARSCETVFRFLWQREKQAICYSFRSVGDEPAKPLRFASLLENRLGDD